MKNENKTSLYKKLLKVQQEVGKLTKDQTAKAGSFNYKYFDINQIIDMVNPVLTDNELVLIQPIQDGNQCSIITDPETGENVSSYLELPKLSDPQKLGSAITYYRRYTLCSLLALQAEDDDAKSASEESKKPINYEGHLKECKTQEALGVYYRSMPKDKQQSFAKLVTDLKLNLSE